MITDVQLSKMSDLQASLLFCIRAYNLPEPEAEYRFSPSRKWRFDFSWPSLRVGVEVDGGTWSGGRHTRGAGFEKDCEKINAAQELGWRVFRYTSSMVKNGQAVEQLARILRG